MTQYNISSITGYHLSITYGTNILFENISFTVSRGDVLLIVGPNGAGKTTLLKTISGLQPISKGDVCVNSTNDATSLKKLTHFLESTPLYRENQSVLDYLSYWTVLLNGTTNVSYEYIGNAVTQLELHHLLKHNVAQLSLGQRKRVLLSKLLLTNRPIWILDEPGIGLDKHWVDVLSSLISKHRTNGGIVIITTHTYLYIDLPYTLVIGNDISYK